VQSTERKERKGLHLDNNSKFLNKQKVKILCNNWEKSIKLSE
jgi:hypothetical protein